MDEPVIQEAEEIQPLLLRVEPRTEFSGAWVQVEPPSHTNEDLDDSRPLMNVDLGDHSKTSIQAIQPSPYRWYQSPMLMYALMAIIAIVVCIVWTYMVVQASTTKQVPPMLIQSSTSSVGIHPLNPIVRIQLT